MLLLGGAESMPKVIPGRVTWLSALPMGDERRPIIRAERACSGSNRPTISTSSLSKRPHRSRHRHDASFSWSFAGRRPIPTGHKKRWPVLRAFRLFALFQVFVLRVLAVGGGRLFGLVVRQRRYGIGVVLDFGFRRVLAVQPELLVERSEEHTSELQSL